MKEETELLYVDDELINLFIFEKMFQNSCAVHVAGSGVKALEILENKPSIKIIISDIRMPEMDGFELLNIVKNSWPNTSRYLLSGYFKDEKIENAIETGLIKKFISKPFSKSDIESLISEND